MCHCNRRFLYQQKLVHNHIVQPVIPPQQQQQPGRTGALVCAQTAALLGDDPDANIRKLVEERNALRAEAASLRANYVGERDRRDRIDR